MTCPNCKGKGMVPCDIPGFPNTFDVCFVCEGTGQI